MGLKNKRREGVTVIVTLINYDSGEKDDQGAKSKARLIFLCHSLFYSFNCAELFNGGNVLSFAFIGNETKDIFP